MLGPAALGGKGVGWLEYGECGARAGKIEEGQPHPSR